jgi:hypothetical protein
MVVASFKIVMMTPTSSRRFVAPGGNFRLKFSAFLAFSSHALPIRPALRGVGVAQVAEAVVGAAARGRRWYDGSGVGPTCWVNLRVGAANRCPHSGGT